MKTVVIIVSTKRAHAVVIEALNAAGENFGACYTLVDDVEEVLSRADDEFVLQHLEEIEKEGLVQCIETSSGKVLPLRDRVTDPGDVSCIRRGLLLTLAVRDRS